MSCMSKKKNCRKPQQTQTQTSMRKRTMILRLLKNKRKREVQKVIMLKTENSKARISKVLLVTLSNRLQLLAKWITNKCLSIYKVWCKVITANQLTRAQLNSISSHNSNTFSTINLEMEMQYSNNNPHSRQNQKCESRAVALIKQT